MRVWAATASYSTAPVTMGLGARVPGVPATLEAPAAVVAISPIGRVRAEFGGETLPPEVLLRPRGADQSLPGLPTRDEERFPGLPRRPPEGPLAVLERRATGVPTPPDLDSRAKAPTAPDAATEGSANAGGLASTEASQRALAEARRRADDARARVEATIVRALASRDAEVRAHEAAHVAAAGGLAGAPSYTFQMGPDGRAYAVGGEVSISLSDGQTPAETISRARRVRAAALAPGDPSPQDLAVAAAAMSMELRASEELRRAQSATSSAPGQESTSLRSAPAGSGIASHLHSSSCGVCTRFVAAYQAGIGA